MTKVMKIFESIQKQFGLLGIQSTLCPQRYSFNVKNSIALLILGQCSIISIIFLIFETKSLKDYADSLYMSATAILLTFNFLVYILNTSNIFELIANFENTIEKRKLKTRFLNKLLKFSLLN